MALATRDEREHRRAGGTGEPGALRLDTPAVGYNTIVVDDRDPHAQGFQVVQVATTHHPIAFTSHSALEGSTWRRARSGRVT